MKGLYPQDELDELTGGFEVDDIQQINVTGIDARRRHYKQTVVKPSVESTTATRVTKPVATTIAVQTKKVALGKQQQR